jgi:hypothetical protein
MKTPIDLEELHELRARTIAIASGFDPDAMSSFWPPRHGWETYLPMARAIHYAEAAAGVVTVPASPYRAPTPGPGEKEPADG